MTVAPVRAVGAAAVLALVAAACGGGGDDAADTTTTSEQSTTTTSTTTTSTTTTSTTTTTTTTTIPDPEEPPRQPLTGEPVDDEDDIEQRPALAVKVDNAPPARPNQSGFSEADLVFEEIVEGNITRFAVVFHSDHADPIGPIRSGRTQDVDLLSSLNEPLFAWSGGNAGVTRAIRDSFLTDLNWQNNVGSYSRGAGPEPHNLYSSTERLYELTPEDHPGAPPQQFGYVLPGEEFEGRSVDEVDLDMASIDVQWTWNDDDEVWERSQEGEPHEEGDGDRLTSTNVVIMAVEYRPSAVDARSPEAQTIGEGLVYVFSDGQLVEGKWERELAVGPIRLVDLDGEPILLTPGRTWIELADVADAPDDSDAPIAIDIDFGDEG